MVWARGSEGGVRLELCLLICEFVVDRALDLAGLLQELHMELKDNRRQKTVSGSIPSGCNELLYWPG